MDTLYNTDRRNQKGQTDIPNAGRIVYDVTLNLADLRKRREEKNPYYRASVDPSVYSLFPGDLIFQDLTTGTIFAAMNGLFSEKDNKIQVISNMKFLGINTNLFEWDPEDRRGSITFPLITGGLSTIQHNGNEVIPANTEAYWEIPDRQKVNDKYGQGERVLPFLVPFSTASYNITEKSIVNAIHCMEEEDNDDYDIEDVFGHQEAILPHAAKLLRASKLSYVPLILHSLLSHGIINKNGINWDILSPNRKHVRSNNSIEFKAVKDTTEYQNFILSLFAGLHLLDTPTDDLKKIERDGVTSLDEKTLRERLLDDLYPTIEDDYIFPLQNGIVGGDERGSALRKQLNLVSDELAALKTAQKFIQSRVIARVLTECKPGSEPDIQLGHSTF